MYYILFLSRTNSGYLRNIITEGVANNEALGITSKLVYCEDYYLQYMEGEKDTIEALFSITESDNRHNIITIVSKDHIANRLCESPLEHKPVSPSTLTTMGCSDLNEFCNSLYIGDKHDIIPIFKKLGLG